MPGFADIIRRLGPGCRLNKVKKPQISAVCFDSTSQPVTFINIQPLLLWPTSPSHFCGEIVICPACCGSFTTSCQLRERARAASVLSQPLSWCPPQRFPSFRLQQFVNEWMEVLLSTTFYELPFIHSRYFAEAAQGYQGKTVTRQIHCYFFVFIVQFQITFCFPRSILIFLVLPLHSASRSLYVTDCCCLLPLSFFFTGFSSLLQSLFTDILWGLIPDFLLNSL